MRKENLMTMAEYGDIPVDPKEAQAVGLKTYYPGKECKRGHITSRSVSNRACKECARLKMQEKRKDPKVKQREYEYNKRYYQENKETVHAWNKRWYQENSEKVREKKKEYRQENKDKCNAHREEKRRRLALRTPQWAEMDKIKEFYEDARELRELTAIDFHVDHIIPLKGKTVSGLHVLENLRIVTARENMTKHNDLVEELLE